MIHCVMGRSRSVTILLAYMMRQLKFGTLKKCMDYVMKYREIKLNANFLLSLIELEKRVLGKTSIKRWPKGVEFISRRKFKERNSTQNDSSSTIPLCPNFLLA